MNPYEVLGVAPTASPDEVKKAYRKKARENHPDLNPGDAHAADRMNEINEAYDRILNPEKYATRDAREAAVKAAQQRASQGGSQPGGASSTGYNPYRGASGQGTSGNPGQNPYSSGGPNGWAGYGFDWDDLFGFGYSGSASSAPIHPEVSAQDSPIVREIINDINANRYQKAVESLNTITSHGRDARWYYLSALANNGAGNTLMALEQIRRAVRMDPNNLDYQRVQRQFQAASQTYEQEVTNQGFSMGIDPVQLCCMSWCCCSVVAPVAGPGLICCI